MISSKTLEIIKSDKKLIGYLILSVISSVHKELTAIPTLN